MARSGYDTENTAVAGERPGRYTRPAVILHWAIAVLILTNIALAWSVGFWPDSDVRPVIDLHKSFGITVLGLAILRILWRATHRPPSLPSRYPFWERALAHVAHVSLYVLILAMPLSGWMHDSAWSGAASHPMKLYGVIPWFRIGAITNLPAPQRDSLHDLFGAAHVWLGYILDALVLAHIAGALKHQLIDREPQLQRML